MRVKGEHLAGHLPAVIEGDAKAVVDEREHLAPL